MNDKDCHVLYVLKISCAGQVLAAAERWQASFSVVKADILCKIVSRLDSRVQNVEKESVKWYI